MAVNQYSIHSGQEVINISLPEMPAIETTIVIGERQFIVKSIVMFAYDSNGYSKPTILYCLEKGVERELKIKKAIKFTREDRGGYY